MAKSLPPRGVEQLITQIDAKRKEVGYISRADQQDLRHLLTSADAEANACRDRVIELLNPRCTEIVHLTDEELHHSYRITNEDNYDLKDTVYADIVAVFDASHGYYVVREGRLS